MKLDRRSFLKLTGLTGLTTAAALTLSACGGDSDTTPTNTQAPATSAPAATSQPNGPTQGNAAEEAQEYMDQLAAAASFYPNFIEGHDNLIVATSNDGGTFNPYSRTRWGSVVNTTFIALIANNNVGKEVLMLLKKYEKIDDLTYDLELWDCIYDKFGNNFTAEDIVWSVQQFYDSGNAGGIAYTKVENDKVCIDVTGKYTVRWHCSAPFAPGELVKNFGNPSMVIQESYESTGEDMMASKPSGTGPYDVKEYVAGNKVVWEAKDNYWFMDVYNDAANKDWMEENLPDAFPLYRNLKTIEWHIIPDAASRATALEMGSVDACDSMSGADVKYFSENPNLGVTPFNIPVGAPIAFYFNCNEDSGSPCNNLDMRKAVCTAIDNQAIADGCGAPAYPVYGLLPNLYDSPAEWKSGREYYDYDVDKAKEYLAASGYNSEKVVIMYMSNTVIDNAIILVDSQLRAIGVNTELYPVEQTVMDTKKYDFSAWDILFETFGGGNYLVSVAKRWCSDDSAISMTGAGNPGNMNICGAIDEELDNAYRALKENSTADGALAKDTALWDQIITFDKCYCYAIIGYYNQSAAKSSVNVVLYGSQNQLCCGAFTFND